MKTLSQIAAASLLILVQCAVAFAQSTNEQPTNDDGLSTRWAIAYGLAGLGVVLGLVNVCRPGKRKGDTPKPG